MFHFTNKPEKRKNTFNSKFLKFIQISAFQESTQPLQSITFTRCFQLNIFAYTGEKKKKMVYTQFQKPSQEEILLQELPGICSLPIGPCPQW